MELKTSSYISNACQPIVNSHLIYLCCRQLCNATGMQFHSSTNVVDHRCLGDFARLCSPKVSNRVEVLVKCMLCSCSTSISFKHLGANYTFMDGIDVILILEARSPHYCTQLLRMTLCCQKLHAWESTAGRPLFRLEYGSAM